MLATLSVLLGLLLPFQIADTSRTSADSLVVADTSGAVLLDTTGVEAIDSTLQPVLQEVPQQVPRDTVPVLEADLPEAEPSQAPEQVLPQTPLPLDTTVVDTTEATPQARTDSVNVPGLDAVEDQVGALFEGIEREAAALQRALTRQVDLLRGALSLRRLLLVLLAGLLAYGIIWLVVRSLAALGRWRPVWMPRIQRLIPMVKFGLWLVAIWVILSNLLGRSGLLLGVMLLLVLAAGMLALFYVLRDLFGGLVLLFERPFQIGSRVTVGGHAGEVRKIGLRTFELVTPAGSVVTVPNAEILRDAIVSMALDTPEEPVVVTLAFPALLDVGRAQMLAREAAFTSPYVVARRPVAVRLVEDGAAANQLAVSAYVFDARHAEALESDIRRLARAAFEACSP